MRQRNLRRLAALALVAALAAPAAWAGPGGVGGWELGGVWSWFARVLGGWADKDGPCIHPDGNPLCTPAPAAPTAADRRQSGSKHGPCIDPLGRPIPCAAAGGPAATSRRLSNGPRTPRNR